MDDIEVYAMANRVNYAVIRQIGNIYRVVGRFQYYQEAIRAIALDRALWRQLRSMYEIYPLKGSKNLKVV